MKKLEERTTADMEVALEQVCRVLPQGGDHKKRKRVTRKLMHSARHGKTSLGDFMMVARTALNEHYFEKSHSSSQMPPSGEWLGRSLLVAQPDG